MSEAEGYSQFSERGGGSDPQKVIQTRQAGLLTFGSAGDSRRESLWDNFRVARDTLRGAQDEDLPQACESYNLGLGSQQAITPEKSATLP